MRSVQPCRVCKGPKERNRPGRKVCDACRVNYEKWNRDKKKKEYEERAVKFAEQGLNSKGNKPGRPGWRGENGGLTPLKNDPFLDYDYEFETTPQRLSWREMRELL